MPELTALVEAKVAIVANIGPAQGDQTIPSDAPVTKPDKKELPSFLLPPALELTFETIASSLAENAGTRSDKPRISRITTATNLKISGSKPNRLTR